MNIFDYGKIKENINSHQIVNLLTKIYEYKGKQELYMQTQKDILESMLNFAKIQSVDFSNRIEGIITTKDRLNKIVKDQVIPETKAEKEIEGYKDVLEMIHYNYEHIPIKPSIILQLHKDLYKKRKSSFAGKWKTIDNIIQETDSLGNKSIRFKPLSAFETPDAIDMLCEEYNKAIDKDSVNPLILISKFIFDFLSIHPFSDGNGRISRLLTLLLLYKQGFIVGKYISIEAIIEKSKDDYYLTLKQSSDKWIDNDNNEEPFIKYYLGVIIEAYGYFSDKVFNLNNSKMTKIDRIKAIFNENLKQFSKSDIKELCDNISQSTIEKTLAKLVNENYIIKVGKGKSTKYIRNNLK